MDAVIVVTDHSPVDYRWVVKHSPLVVDTRNVSKDLKAFGKKIVKA